LPDDAPSLVLPAPPPPAGPDTPEPTLGALIAMYERDYLTMLAPKTQYQRKRMHTTILRQLGAALPVRELTPPRLRAWREQLRATYAAPSTTRHYMQSFCAVLRVAVDELGWLEQNPILKVRRPPEPPGRVRWLTDEERARLLAACRHSHNPYLLALVLLAIATGCRKNELRQLTWEQVDLAQGALRLQHTKNGERRAIPVCGLALEHLRALHAQRRLGVPWVFPAIDGQKPMDFGTAWAGAVQRAQVTDFRFHDLRHTTASYLAMSGATLLELSHVLGHKTLAMVKRYSHLSDPHIGHVMQRMVSERLTDEAPPPVVTPPPTRKKDPLLALEMEADPWRPTADPGPPLESLKPEGSHDVETS